MRPSVFVFLCINRITSIKLRFRFIARPISPPQDMTSHLDKFSILCVCSCVCV